MYTLIATPLLASPSAFAGEPVVTVGAVDDAVARVAAATGRPEAGFDVVQLATLLLGPPVMVGGGAVTPCAGAPTKAEQLTWVIGRVEGALAYGEFDKAATEQLEADRVASCLGGPVDARSLARVALLRGVGLAATDPTRATAAFTQALVLDPAPAWDEAWSPDAKALLLAVPHRTDTVTLRVVAPAGQVAVDGAPGVTASVLPGEHLVQVDGGALVVTVPEGGGVLVVPSACAPTIASDDDRSAFAALLAAGLGEGTAGFVVNDRAVYAITAGRQDFLTLAEETTPPARTAGRIVAGTGVVVTVGGGVATLVSYLRTDRAATDVTAAESAQDFADRSAEYESVSGTYRKLRYVPIAGIAAIAIGLGIDAAAKPREVFAAPLPGGAMFGVRGVW